MKKEAVLFTAKETEGVCVGLERAFSAYQDHKETSFLANDVAGVIIKTVENVLTRVLRGEE